jgi:hypothetical protein
MTPPRRQALLVGAVATLAAIGGFVVGGYAVGASGADDVDWYDVTVQVVGEPDRPLVSVDVDGWTYAIRDSVPHWIDAQGAVHTGGWPSCLEPNPVGANTQAPRTVPIRFAAVSVDVDGFGWREVVSVDCRTA